MKLDSRPDPDQLLAQVQAEEKSATRGGSRFSLVMPRE